MSINANSIRQQAQAKMASPYMSGNAQINNFELQIPYLEPEELVVGGYTASAKDENGGTVSAFLSSEEVLHFGEQNEPNTSRFISNDRLTNMQWDKNNDGNPEMTLRQDYCSPDTRSWVVTEVKTDDNSNGIFESITGYEMTGGIKYQDFDLNDNGIIEYSMDYDYDGLVSETFDLNEDHKPDFIYEYNEDEVILTEYTYDDEASFSPTSTKKTITNKDGVITSIKEDTNADGKIDYLSELNEDGELERHNQNSFLSKVGDFFKGIGSFFKGIGSFFKGIGSAIADLF